MALFPVVDRDCVILAPPGSAALARLAGLAGAEGYEHEVLGAILAVRGAPADLDAFVLRCSASSSPADAAATRVLVWSGDLRDATAFDVLGPALAAESLATIAARSLHRPMLDALEAGIGVESVYQPVTEISSGRIVGFEALLRFEHGGRTVPPLEVFRAAADSCRLPAADAAARTAAIASAAGWIGRRVLYLNLHPESITCPADLDGTAAAVVAAGLEPAQVVFEPSMPLDGDLRHLTRLLEHLRARGFGISLDDVTADPAMLALIERLRPDCVKVAASLARDLPAVQARSAVAIVVGAAHAVGARVSAKGIETRAQLEAVLFVGVDDAQGWQVGQPMTAPGRLAVRAG